MGGGDSTGVDATLCDITRQFWASHGLQITHLSRVRKNKSHVPIQTKIGFFWRGATYLAAKSCNDFLISNVKMGNRGTSFVLTA